MNNFDCLEPKLLVRKNTRRNSTQNLDSSPRQETLDVTKLKISKKGSHQDLMKEPSVEVNLEVQKINTKSFRPSFGAIVEECESPSMAAHPYMTPVIEKKPTNLASFTPIIQ